MQIEQPTKESGNETKRSAKISELYEGLLSELISDYGNHIGLTEETDKRGQLHYRLREYERCPGVWISRDDCFGYIEKAKERALIERIENAPKFDLYENPSDLEKGLISFMITQFPESKINEELHKDGNVRYRIAEDKTDDKGLRIPGVWISKDYAFSILAEAAYQNLTDR